MNSQQKMLQIHFESFGSFMEQNVTSSSTNNQAFPSPKKEASPTSDFQFVNISVPSEIKGTETRKFIRSSVAYNYRRKQFLRHSNSSSEGSDSHSCLDANPRSSAEKNFCPVCGFSLRKKSRCRTPHPDSRDSSEPEKDIIETAILGAGRVDPFAVFPIATKPYMHTLIDHYLTRYCPTLQPFGKWDSNTSPIITQFFRLGIQNPLYFHCMLCIAATHFDLCSGQNTFGAIACLHRGEAIKLLNALLRDKKCLVTDLMLAAVGSLADYDILVGDTTALENHRKGMIAMIKVRGGIDDSGIDDLIRHRALWIDCMSATYTRTLPLISTNSLSSLPSKRTDYVLLATTGFRSILGSTYNLSPTIQSLQELVSLTSELRNIRDVRPSEVDLVAFTARRSLIERGLAITPYNSSDGVENCCRLAALIYTNIVLRKMPSASAVLSHFTNDLKFALEETDLSSLWPDRTELLIWVLFQGAAASTEAELKKWYLNYLVSVCKSLELQTWKEILQVLEGFLWASCDMVKRCKPLWYEIVVGLETGE